MDNKILMICPTRGRGDKIDYFYNRFQENSSITDLVFSLDEDDYNNYPKFTSPNVKYEVGHKNDIVPAMNYVAYKYAQYPQYEYIGMLNDDHFIETKNWDQIVYEKIKNQKISISYFNDKTEGYLDNNLRWTLDVTDKISFNYVASSILMSKEIIQCLGYIAEPTTKHAFPDVIWVELGKKLNCLNYFEEIIFNHTKIIKDQDGIKVDYNNLNE